MVHDPDEHRGGDGLVEHAASAAERAHLSRLFLRFVARGVALWSSQSHGGVRCLTLGSRAESWIGPLTASFLGDVSPRHVELLQGIVDFAKFLSPDHASDWATHD